MSEFFDTAYAELAAEQRRGSPLALQQQFIDRFVLSNRSEPRVLDHCCGHGRHAEWLVSMGADVTGVDKSPDSIREAEIRIGGNASLICGDAREFDPEGEFDAILSMESSIACFDRGELASILSRLARSLKPSGIMLLHVFNPNYVRMLPGKTWIQTSSGLVVLESRRFDPTGKRLTIRQQRFVPCGDSLYRASAHTLDQHAYQLHELTELLLEAGLAVESVYGSFEGAPFEPASPEIIVLCGAAG